MSKADRAARSATSRRWRAVPFAQRREALRCAKSGDQHPDPDVAATAAAFAGMCLESRSTRVLQYLCLTIGSLVLAEMLLLRDGLGIVLALFVLGWGGFLWDLRRDSRRILAARTGPGTGP